MTCDECGIELEADDWHAPHDENCPGVGDCGCDNVTCSDCCWECAT
jgi:hypothetical protein